MQKNIFLFGYMGSGKSSIAKKMEEEYGYVVYSFASEVKSIATMILGRAIDKKTDRLLLQQVGQYLKKGTAFLTNEERATIKEWGNSKKFIDYCFNKTENGGIFSPEYFAQKLFNNFSFQKNFLAGNVVVDDMRFKVEQNYAYKIQREKGIPTFQVYVNVPEVIRRERLIKRDGGISEEGFKDPFDSEKDIIEMHSDYQYFFGYEERPVKDIAIEIYMASIKE